MIRLSRLADYAVALMTHIADRPDSLRTTTQLAMIMRLSAPTVSKVLNKLTRAGLLVSYRGVVGGYTLARAPWDVSIAEVISAVDGPIAMTDCIEGSPGACFLETTCPARAGWQKINDAIRGALEGVTLADVMPSMPSMPFAGVDAPRHGDKPLGIL